MDEQEWAPVRYALTEAQRRVRDAAEVVVWRLLDAAHGNAPAEARIAAIREIEAETLTPRRRATAADVADVLDRFVLVRDALAGVPDDVMAELIEALVGVSDAPR